MEERKPLSPTRHTGLQQSDRARSWVEAYAAHVRKRFDSRAIVSVRLPGAPPVELSHVYSLESGGLVLVTCCGHPHHGDAHEHGTGIPEHHRDHAGQPREAVGHEHGGDQHPHAGHGHAHGGDDHAGEDHECSAAELWLAAPDQAIFEAHCAEEGALCTGFGYLGLSRTPHMLIRRGTQAPPKPGHEHDNF